jgi:Fanconi anemia group I protein
LRQIPQIREAVESISQLTPEIASELLFALEPIVHLNPAFQDHVVLVLRKAMFNRELQAKKIAVSGFLQLLKGAKLSGTDAALMKQQQFALDVLGFLKRCLSHQYEIRELLYKGLADIYAANPDVREWVLAPLISQLSIYYAAEAPYPVFALKKCLELKNSKVTLNEPLSQLIQAVSSCMVVSKGVNSTHYVLEVLILLKI